MKIRKFIVLFFLLCIAGSAFSQEGEVNSCVLDPSNPCKLTMKLHGAKKSPEAQVLVTSQYQSASGTIDITIQLQGEQPYTHLWFPRQDPSKIWKVSNINELKEYFELDKDRRTNMKLDISMKPQFKKKWKQIFVSDGDERSSWSVVDYGVPCVFRPVKSNTISIKVNDRRQQEVKVTLQNIVPLTADNDDCTKATLHYIAEPITITFRLLSDGCWGKMELVDEYKAAKASIPTELKKIYANNPSSPDQKELMKLYLKYYSLRHPTEEDLKCQDLKEGFADFYQSYKMIEGEVVITLDSLKALNGKMDTLLNGMLIAFSNKNRELCQKWKTQAQSYLAISLNTSTYAGDPELKIVQDKVLDFNRKNEKLKEYCNRPCPGGTPPTDCNPDLVRQDEQKLQDLSNELLKLTNPKSGDYLNESKYNSYESQFNTLKDEVNVEREKKCSKCQKPIKDFDSTVEMYEKARAKYLKLKNSRR